MGELVDQLEALGYVERRPDPDDRRVRRVYRTEQAREASAAAAKAAAASQAKVEAALGQAAVDELHEMLAALIETFDPPRGKPGAP